MHHSLGEMRIKLKEGVCLIRKRPCKMNPNLCIKVKEEIDEMLKSEIIERIED